MKDNNPFDNIGLNLDPEELTKEQTEQESKHNKLDYLIHQTFAQTESGVELLKLWEEALIISPGASPNMDQIQVGIIEGRKSMIRNIILTIRKVERND